MVLKDNSIVFYFAIRIIIHHELIEALESLDHEKFLKIGVVHEHFVVRNNNLETIVI